MHKIAGIREKGGGALDLLLSDKLQRLDGPLHAQYKATETADREVKRIFEHPDGIGVHSSAQIKIDAIGQANIGEQACCSIAKRIPLHARLVKESDDGVKHSIDRCRNSGNLVTSIDQNAARDLPLLNDLRDMLQPAQSMHQCSIDQSANHPYSQENKHGGNQRRDQLISFLKRGRILDKSSQAPIELDELS